jgi:hypothetical protein
MSAATFEKRLIYSGGDNQLIARILLSKGFSISNLAFLMLRRSASIRLMTRRSAAGVAVGFSNRIDGLTQASFLILIGLFKLP